MSKLLTTLLPVLAAQDIEVRLTADIATIAPTDLTYDSRKVTPGTLFLCKGAGFRAEYLEKARAVGAVAYIAEVPYPEVDLPGVIVGDMRKALAYTADWFYDSPWRKLRMIAVTGTKGKSTTVTFLKRIFDTQARATGTPLTGLTSTQWIYDGTEMRPATLTTPENVDLYRYLHTAVQHGLSTMIVEVSSQALKYDRVGGLRFDHGVFLNISPDHISDIEHPNFDDYFASKRMLFNVTEHVHINRDSDGLSQLLTDSAGCAERTFFSTTQPADVYADHICPQGDLTAFDVHTAKRTLAMQLPMHGRFNIDNALAAISVALACGVDPTYIQEGIRNTEMDGHMLYVQSDETPPLTVVVDYAHNEISFEKVFVSVQEEFPHAPCIVVFGAPGDKAVSRRSGLGAVASRHADRIYLTADDPAHETVSDINTEIRRHYERDVPTTSIDDRPTAIRDAILSAPAGAVVLLLGKGSERLQKIAAAPQPYDGDEAYARQALAERKEQGIQPSQYFAQSL